MKGDGEEELMTERERRGVTDAFEDAQFVHCGLHVGRNWVSTTCSVLTFGTVPGTDGVPRKCLKNEGKESPCTGPKRP